ncbi:MAG: hypothetical protein ACW99A_23710, partial [Candidatus Kariarchaeaceae archaeon]
MKKSIIYKISVILFLLNIFFSVYSPTITNSIQQESESVPLKVQDSTEYLIAYTDTAQVDPTGEFQIFLGVYSPTQGFLGNRNVEYYHTDIPQIKFNISTLTGDFTDISWELLNQPGLQTIEFSYNAQVVKVDVIATDIQPTGTDQVNVDTHFLNDYPSLGADNVAQININPLGVPLIQFDGSEVLTVKTATLINGDNHQLVLGYIQMNSGIFTNSLNYEVQFKTPIWWQSGTSVPVKIIFSGNTLYSSVTKDYLLPVRDSGQDLLISLPNGVSGGDRSSFGETSNTFDLTVQISGDNPIGITLDISFELNGTQTDYFITDYGITGFISTIPISIPYDHPLGTGELIAEIKKESLIISEHRLPFTVFDELATSLSFSTEILLPNQSVEILVYTYREDTYQPEAASVTIYEDASLVTTVLSLETDESGYKRLNYTIPHSGSGKTLDWWIEVEPSINSDYNGQIIQWPVSIVGETNIKVNSDLFIRNRGDIISLSAQILANTQVVSEGTLSLYSVETNTLIADFDLSQTNEIN